MVGIETPHRVSFLVFFLVKADRDHFVLPIFHKAKEVPIKSLPDRRIGQIFKGMSIVEHFLAVENNRLVRVGLKISVLNSTPTYYLE